MYVARSAYQVDDGARLTVWQPSVKWRYAGKRHRERNDFCFTLRGRDASCSATLLHLSDSAADPFLSQTRR